MTSQLDTIVQPIVLHGKMVLNTADRMELDRSTGNLDIEGTLTEGSAL